MGRVVTISSSYGAGGSVIGPAVADSIGVPFMNRAVSASAASGEMASGGEGAAVEERTSGLIERIVATFANLPDAFSPGAPAPPGPVGSDDVLRRQAEERVRAFVSEHGAGVILGWGATVLIPDAFHVRLYGPVDRRVERAMEIEGISRPEAERRQVDTDRVRGQYLRRMYGREWNDLNLYHLALDSTAIGLEEGAKVLCAAANAFWANQPAHS